MKSQKRKMMESKEENIRHSIKLGESELLVGKKNPRGKKFKKQTCKLRYENTDQRMNKDKAVMRE